MPQELLFELKDARVTPHIATFGGTSYQIANVGSVHVGRRKRSNPLAVARSPRRPGRRTQRIKARLLFIAQRIVKFRERGPYGLHRAERGVEPLLHRLDSSGRGQSLIGRAVGLEPFRLSSSLPDVIAAI